MSENEVADVFIPLVIFILILLVSWGMTEFGKNEDIKFDTLDSCNQLPGCWKYKCIDGVYKKYDYDISKRSLNLQELQICLMEERK